MQSLENLALAEQLRFMHATLVSHLARLAAFTDDWIPDWAFALAVFAAIVAAGIALQGAMTRFLKARPAAWHPFAKHAWDSTRGLVRFMLALFAMSVALPLLHLPHDFKDDVRRIFLALFVIQLGWIIAVIANIAMDRYVFGLKLDVADNLLARKAVTQMRIVRQAVNVLIGTLTAGFALMSFELGAPVRHLALRLGGRGGHRGGTGGAAPVRESDRGSAARLHPALAPGRCGGDQQRVRLR